MKILNDFQLKQRKYMPVFAKATGKPTIYIEGYPCEDKAPMPATEFHGMQMHTLFDQFLRYFQADANIHVGMDNFIYYHEGDLRKVVAPDVYVVLGASRYPLRRSFYTWAEGVVPTVVFEFLSDATGAEDRNEKVAVYLQDIGVSEYFIHQPDMERPIEFRGWRRSQVGAITEIVPDVDSGLFSESLNLYFRWETQQETQIRLLRPYLPDGTPITTSTEEHQLRLEEHQLRLEERQLRLEEHQLRMEEHQLRIAAEGRANAAETLASEEAHRRREVEAELERLRAQLANAADSDIS